MSTNKQEHCLICVEDAYRRGLCNRHYHQYTRAVAKAKREGLDVDAIEAEWIAEGNLLPDGRSGDNPFASKVAEKQAKYVSSKLESNADADAKRLQAKHGKPPATGRKKKSG